LSSDQHKRPACRTFWYKKILPLYAELEAKYLAGLQKKSLEKESLELDLDASDTSEKADTVITIQKEVESLKTYLESSISLIMAQYLAIMETKIQDLQTTLDKVNSQLGVLDHNVLQIPKVGLPTTKSKSLLRSDPDQGELTKVKAIVYGIVHPITPQELLALDKEFPEFEFQWITSPSGDFTLRCNSVEVVFFARKTTSRLVLGLIRSSKASALGIGSDLNHLKEEVRAYKHCYIPNN
jgi:hypothetical protein